MPAKVTILSLSFLLMCLLTACGSRADVRTEEEAERSDILIVYFSRYGNTEYSDDVDATTSASIVADGNGRYGTTEYVAELIRQTVGGDIHRIETAAPYTADFEELREVNHEEMQQDFLPELKESHLEFDDLGSREDVTFSIAQ